ncbi:MAG: hypothetical protein AB1806_09495 [Acidobacteriota bacterium]
MADKDPWAAWLLSQSPVAAFYFLSWVTSPDKVLKGACWLFRIPARHPGELWGTAGGKLIVVGLPILVVLIILLIYLGVLSPWALALPYVLIFAGLIVIKYRTPSPSRWWARVDLGPDKSLLLRPRGEAPGRGAIRLELSNSPQCGLAETSQAPKRRRDIRRLWFKDSPDRYTFPADVAPLVSIAVSADGLVVGTLVGQELALSTLNPWNGNISQWKGRVVIPTKWKDGYEHMTASGLLAVAACGEHRARVVVRATTIPQASGEGPSTETAAVFLINDDKAVLLEVCSAANSVHYAALLSGRSFYLPGQSVRALSGKDSDRTPFAQYSGSVVAMDAAATSAGYLVAVLSKRENGVAVAWGLVNDSAPPFQYRLLRSPATHISIVRDPRSRKAEATVLCGGHRAVTAITVPLATLNGSEGGV